MTESVEDRRWLILAVLCVAVLLVGVDNTIVNVALPTLSEQLRATNTDLQWIVDGYSLPFAGLLLMGGGARTALDESGSCKVRCCSSVCFPSSRRDRTPSKNCSLRAR